MSNASKFLIFSCGTVVLLHVWAAASPSHDNWGIHFFAFYDVPFRIAALALLAVMAVPLWQAKLLGRLEWLLRGISRLPALVGYLAVAGLVYAGILLFPVKLHLLGDGAILLRSVPLGIGSPEITASFKNQPLMFWIYRAAMSLHPTDVSADPYNVYYLLDIAGSILFTALIFVTTRSLQKLSHGERFLLGLILFAGAGSQFFFGYVENYVLQYVCITAYAITGWFALEKRVNLAIPVLLFSLAVLLHLGAGCFLPSVILLILLRLRAGRLASLLVLAGLGALGIAGLFLSGFSISDLTRHLESGSVDFLRPFSAPGGNFPYAMFSARHLIDWLNSLMLVTPVGLFIGAGGWFFLKERRNAPLYFLTTATLCGFFFTWVVNSALGLARDWDLFSGFFAPLLVLGVYFLSREELGIRRYVIGVVAAVSFLHWAAWIGVNADADKHLARMRMLDSPKYLALTTQMVYNEALANFFFDNAKYADARTYYLRFMQIDSSNTRIVGNIADVYRKLGEKDNYFRMLQRAVDLGTKDPGVFSNLGVEYAVRGDTARAIEFNERAVSLNPTMQKAIANLGILYSARKNYVLAEKYFESAIELGMRDPVLFRYAGDVAVFLNNYEKASRYYDAYLGAVPGDARVRSIRDKLRQAIMQGH